jgi:hypothetical protein
METLNNSPREDWQGSVCTAPFGSRPIMEMMAPNQASIQGHGQEEGGELQGTRLSLQLGAGKVLSA